MKKTILAMIAALPPDARREVLMRASGFSGPGFPIPMHEAAWPKTVTEKDLAIAGTQAITNLITSFQRGEYPDPRTIIVNDVEDALGVGPLTGDLIEPLELAYVGEVLSSFVEEDPSLEGDILEGTPKGRMLLKFAKDAIRHPLGTLTNEGSRKNPLLRVVSFSPTMLPITMARKAVALGLAAARKRKQRLSADGDALMSFSADPLMGDVRLEDEGVFDDVQAYGAIEAPIANLLPWAAKKIRLAEHKLKASPAVLSGDLDVSDSSDDEDVALYGGIGDWVKRQVSAVKEGKKRRKEQRQKAKGSSEGPGEPGETKRERRRREREERRNREVQPNPSDGSSNPPESPIVISPSPTGGEAVVLRNDGRTETIADSSGLKPAKLETVAPDPATALVSQKLRSAARDAITAPPTAAGAVAILGASLDPNLYTPDKVDSTADLLGAAKDQWTKILGQVSQALQAAQAEVSSAAQDLDLRRRAYVRITTALNALSADDAVVDELLRNPLSFDQLHNFAMSLLPYVKGALKSGVGSWLNATKTAILGGGPDIVGSVYDTADWNDDITDALYPYDITGDVSFSDSSFLSGDGGDSVPFCPRGGLKQA